MARVTVEDCVEKVADRFELVALAAQRARNIAAGADLTIDRNGEKDTVVALREIGDGKVDPADLRVDLQGSFQQEKPEFEELHSHNDNANAEVDEEDLDIRRAIEEATEKGIDQEESFEDDGFSEESIGDDE